jgi:hypothetical protein
MYVKTLAPIDLMMVDECPKHVVNNRQSLSGVISKIKLCLTDIINKVIINTAVGKELNQQMNLINFSEYEAYTRFRVSRKAYVFLRQFLLPCIPSQRINTWY